MRSVRMLLWSGARCCTSTKAMPGSASAGMPEKNASKAANPPADAPMPTTGKEGFDVFCAGATGGRGLTGSIDCELALVFIILAVTITPHQAGAFFMYATPRKVSRVVIAD